jgi:hypothetical protein
MVAALGYVGAFTDPNSLKGKKLANPRYKIGVFNQLTSDLTNRLGDAASSERYARLGQATARAAEKTTDKSR